MLSSRIIPFVRYSFLPIQSMSGVVFSFFSSKAIVPEEFFVLTFQLSLSNYPGASFKCSLISLWSLCPFASKSPQAYLIVYFFPVIHSLPSVIFEFLWWFIQDSFSLFIISIHSFFPILPVVHKDFLKICATFPLIFSRRISSMKNPLLVINLIWWRISIHKSYSYFLQVINPFFRSLFMTNKL